MGEIFPLASIVPHSGWVTGIIDFALYNDARLDCNGDLNLRNVEYAPNLQSQFVRRNAQTRQELVRAVSDMKVSGRVLVPCGGDLTNQQYRVGYAVEAALTNEAVKQAPAIVRQAALYDQKRAVEMAPPEDAMASALEAGLSAAIGNEASQIFGRQAGTALGQSVSHSLVATSGQDTGKAKGNNAVTRGAKSVGHGFKKLFGKH
jgi:hypothetical protein